MKKYIVFLFLYVLVSADTPLPNNYVLAKTYTVTILGTSTMRDWMDSVGNVTGNIVAEPETDGSIDVQAIRIKMVVRSIKSDMGPAMDNKMYRSLNADANPEILFILDIPVRLMQVHPDEHALYVKGKLTLAGICRPVTMQVNSFTLGQGKLQFEGSQTLNMTDYGVKPPTALFGTIKAHPEITIYFKTIFNK
jgi:polyisoprenoid-binding protein YceI